MINVQARVWSTLLGQKGSAGGFTLEANLARLSHALNPSQSASSYLCMALNGELVASQRGGSHSRQVRRGRARKPGRTMRQMIRCPLFKTMRQMIRCPV